MFGVFFIKKNDKIDEIVQVLNNFYVGAGDQTMVKKLNLPTKKADKRPKPKNKEIIIEDEAGEDDECEKLEIGENALIELCLYYEQSNLSLRDCILCYHEEINKSLNSEFKFDFLGLLNIPKAFNGIQKMFDEMIKKS